MYVKDSLMTRRYRDAIIRLGFSPQHADLLDVERSSSAPARPGQAPRYRLTTGIAVKRRGETVRRVLMLWYAHSDLEIVAETDDRESLATMMIDTLSLLPGAIRSAMADAPAWATEITASAAKGPARQAA